eukprot:256729-Pleurochrysis_carterae.AAC.3
MCARVPTLLRAHRAACEVAIAACGAIAACERSCCSVWTARAKKARTAQVRNTAQEYTRRRVGASARRA